MNMEEILEIADKNGFDYFGKDNTKRIDFIDCYKFRFVKYDNDGKFYTDRYSLADLACNKSFLEALIRIHNVSFDMDDRSSNSIYVHIQMKLISDITLNDGKDFAEKCSEFIGGK